MENKKITVKDVMDNFELDESINSRCKHPKEVLNNSDGWSKIESCDTCKTIIITHYADNNGGNIGNNIIKVYKQ